MKHGQTALFTLRGLTAASCSVLARSIASLIPTPLLRRILPALVAFLWNDAAAYMPLQSPYPGWQSPQRRKQIRTLCKILLLKIVIIIPIFFKQEFIYNFVWIIFLYQRRNNYVCVNYNIMHCLSLH
jgi:hypothetical protein